MSGADDGAAEGGEPCGSARQTAARRRRLNMANGGGSIQKRGTW
jgi:hypothetical protein